MFECQTDMVRDALVQICELGLAGDARVGYDTVRDARVQICELGLPGDTGWLRRRSARNSGAEHGC